MGRTDVSSHCDKPLLYGMYAGPPAAEHVAIVEVRVVVVVVWALVVIGVILAQVDDDARSKR